MIRIPTPELLDTDAGTPAEVAASLNDLRHINRWFGGTGTSVDLVRRVAQADEATARPEPASASRRVPARPGSDGGLSLLEIAAGSGYVPRAVRDRLARHGIPLRLTLLDRAASHVGASRTNGDGAVVADARRLPFRDASFDLVSSNLFLHHLAPDELVACVRESLRVCRRAVLINDLIRHPLHLALVYAGMPLYRSRLTRHDAPASVRQAYTKEEMLDLLHQTGAARIEMESYYLFRMGVVVWKK
jgi:ubiquinone/menaquinone biosynthesis C-methylase UbiE